MGLISQQYKWQKAVCMATLTQVWHLSIWTRAYDALKFHVRHHTPRLSTVCMAENSARPLSYTAWHLSICRECTILPNLTSDLTLCTPTSYSGAAQHNLKKKKNLFSPRNSFLACFFDLTYLFLLGFLVIVSILSEYMLSVVLWSLTIEDLITCEPTMEQQPYFHSACTRRTVEHSVHSV